MKKSFYTTFASTVLLMVFPFMMGCSVLSGSGYSNDPIVAEQQRRIESLEAEVDRAEQEKKDAEQREKAAKSKLKAAKDELKVLKTEAERRSS
ncbi:hypothetical protein [Rufibacter tibetensis]|uniref:Uncharacterized protein n=1 Tax=Rufibacter tibetensis TaxID=512763 RepID=A0A0P0C5B3_9BACT|nr:hypothetical protein [Rufibacter tibetensis]ALJ00114.1 hypothetical protein DC20_15470 [Rufibacter tibetensis]